MSDSTNTPATLADESDANLSDEVRVKDLIDSASTETKVETAAEEPPTLREVFEVPEKPTDRGDDNWQALQERLTEEAKGIKWIAAMPDLGAKICELLDIKIHNVLLTAWKKADSLREVLESSRKSPDKSSFLDLAEHSIDYATKPSVDVKIKGVTAKKITLDVALNMKLKGFTLKVQNGGIREIQTGSCEVKGTIKYDKLPIAEKKLTPIKFPLSIRIPVLLGEAAAAETEPSAPEQARAATAAAGTAIETPVDEPTNLNPPLERIEL
jgi:hypothetical protein